MYTSSSEKMDIMHTKLQNINKLKFKKRYKTDNLRPETKDRCKNAQDHFRIDNQKKN